MQDTLFLENSQVIQQTLPVHAVVCGEVKKMYSGESLSEPFQVGILRVQEQHEDAVAPEVQTLTHTSLASF